MDQIPKTPYIITILLKCEQIMDMNIWLLKTLPRCKVEISSHFIDLQEPIHIASFTIFRFYPF